jgi:hypothetical protein
MFLARRRLVAEFFFHATSFIPRKRFSAALARSFVIFSSPFTKGCRRQDFHLPRGHQPWTAASRGRIEGSSRPVQIRDMMRHVRSCFMWLSLHEGEPVLLAGSLS